MGMLISSRHLAINWWIRSIQYSSVGAKLYHWMNGVVPFSWSIQLSHWEVLHSPSKQGMRENRMGDKICCSNNLTICFNQLRLIALNSPRTGALHGPSGVDHQCYRQAREANVQGTCHLVVLALLLPFLLGQERPNYKVSKRRLE